VLLAWGRFGLFPILGICLFRRYRDSIFSGGAFPSASFGAAFVPAMTGIGLRPIAENRSRGACNPWSGSSEAAFNHWFVFACSVIAFDSDFLRQSVPLFLRWSNSWLAATKRFRRCGRHLAFPEPGFLSLCRPRWIKRGRSKLILHGQWAFYIFISLLISYLLNNYNDSVQLRVR